MVNLCVSMLRSSVREVGCCAVEQVRECVLIAGDTYQLQFPEPQRLVSRLAQAGELFQQLRRPIGAFGAGEDLFDEPLHLLGVVHACEALWV